MRDTLIGTIVVGDGAVVMRELALLRRPGLDFAVDRFDYPNPAADFCHALHAMLLPPATRLRDRGADVVMVACTTALMQCAPGTVAAELTAAAGLPVVSVADAMVAVAASTCVRTLAVATPYGARNNAIIRDFFESAGLRVVALDGLDLDRTLEHWLRTAQALSPAAVAALVGGLDDARADAICLPSTGIVALTVAARVGRPAMTAISAGVWASLDRLGVAGVRSHAHLLAMIGD